MNRLTLAFCAIAVVFASNAFSQDDVPDGHYAGEGAAGIPSNATITEYCYELSPFTSKVCPTYPVGAQCTQKVCSAAQGTAAVHCKTNAGAWSYRITANGPDQGKRVGIQRRANGDASSLDTANPYHCYDGSFCRCKTTGFINDSEVFKCVGGPTVGLTSPTHKRLLAGCKVKWYAPLVNNAGYQGGDYGDEYEDEGSWDDESESGEDQSGGADYGYDGQGGNGDEDQSGDYGGSDYGDYGQDENEDEDQSGDYGGSDYGDEA